MITKLLSCLPSTERNFSPGNKGRKNSLSERICIPISSGYHVSIFHQLFPYISRVDASQCPQKDLEFIAFHKLCLICYYYIKLFNTTDIFNKYETLIWYLISKLTNLIYNYFLMIFSRFAIYFPLRTTQKEITPQSATSYFYPYTCSS